MASNLVLTVMIRCILCDEQCFQCVLSAISGFPGGLLTNIHAAATGNKWFPAGEWPWMSFMCFPHGLCRWQRSISTVNGRSLISSINSLISYSHFQTCSITINLLTRGRRACGLSSVVLTSLQDGVCSHRIIRSGGNPISSHSEVVCSVFHPTVSQRYYWRNNVFDRRW